MTLGKGDCIFQVLAIINGATEERVVFMGSGIDRLAQALT